MACRRSASFSFLAFSFAALLAGLAGCGDGGVGSEEEAEQAYKGLDKSVDKAIQLGFDGFNSASSANISPQEGKGDKAGTITVSGKVDQGSSNNKTMSLDVTMKGYSDDEKLTYDTGGALPTLDMKLSKVPDGTLDGTLAGKFTISGDLEGPVTLSLQISGDLEPDPADTSKVRRKPGTTHITGSADSDYGTYDVDVTR